MKANGNEGCRSLLTSRRVCIRVSGRRHAHANTAQPWDRTLGPSGREHVYPRGGSPVFCTSQPHPADKGRCQGDLGSETTPPIHSEDLPWREAVTGPELMFLKLAGDFQPWRGLAGFLRHPGAYIQSKDSFERYLGGKNKNSSLCLLFRFLGICGPSRRRHTFPEASFPHRAPSTSNHPWPQTH